MKVLCIGDIHAKTWIIPRVEVFIKNKHFDKIIFLGDYLDDWGATPADNELVAQQLLNLHKEYENKVVFLWGNHDLSNIRKGEFICSGYSARNIVAANTLSKLPLQFAFGDSNFLFTHAGVTDAWRKSVGLDLPIIYGAHHYAEDLNKIDARSYNRTGTMRGGWDGPSPVWADLAELTKDPLQYYTQIIGHTPVPKIERYEPANGLAPVIVACDTFSTYPNGKKIGDETVLVVDTENAMGSYSAYNLKELRKE